MLKLKGQTKRQFLCYLGMCIKPISHALSTSPSDKIVRERGSQNKLTISHIERSVMTRASLPTKWRWIYRASSTFACRLARNLGSQLSQLFPNVNRCHPIGTRWEWTYPQCRAVPIFTGFSWFWGFLSIFYLFQSSQGSVGEIFSHSCPCKNALGSRSLEVYS